MVRPSTMIGDATDPLGRSVTTITIGLVNNMPKPALKSTEAEFRALLDAGNKRYNLKLRFFFLAGASSPASYYEPLTALVESSANACRRDGPPPLDGLIVTGTEPVAERLADEPYWPELAHLVDWAAENTVSAIWSCLAAQAAVLRLDGIERRKLPAKLSGVFDCVKASEHVLMTAMPRHWPVPHSRLNDLDEHVLVARGYQILSRARRNGADSFLKQVGQSLFLMLQGHPEYGADCLLREYRRDIRRVMLGQRQTWPELPESYFDAATEYELSGLRDFAAQRSSREVIARFDATVTDVPIAVWHEPATRLYANWLDYLADCKLGVRMTQSRPDITAMVAS